MSIKVNGVVLSDATAQYLETILWSELIHLPISEKELVDHCMDVGKDHPLSGVSENDNLDAHYSLDDFTVEALEGAEHDCSEFYDRADNDGLIERAYRFADDSQIGHDFWMTRQGHGAGFWDGDYKDDTDDVGVALTDITKEFGECYVFVDEDGWLHIE